MKPLVTVTIEITEAEFMAIALVGSEEMRTVKQQVRYLVAQDMIRRGLLKAEDLHNYADLVPPKPLETMPNTYQPELVENYFDQPLEEEVAEEKPIPTTLPPRYRGGKETLYWQVFNLFSQHPDKLYTRKDLSDALRIEDKQVVSPIQRLLARNLVVVVEKTTNEEGKEVSVYRLTKEARQLVEERGNQIYGRQ